jgi:hypothetical protein
MRDLIKLVEGLIEGPYEDGRILPRMEDGQPPEILYRIMSKAEYETGKQSGMFGTRDRLHASAEPHFEYCEPGSDNVLVVIQYHDEDGWRAKHTHGMGVVAIVDDLPADRVHAIAKGTRAEIEGMLAEDEEEFDEPERKFPSVKMLDPLLPEIAEAAQKIYDLWDQDEDGYDEEHGSGGICHIIADQIVHIISAAGGDVYTVSDNFEVHVYAVAAFAEGVFTIDIPYRTYETGGGYTWTKIPNVHFTANDVVVNCIDSNPNHLPQYVEGADEEYYESITEAPIGDWKVDPDIHSNEKEMISKFHGYENERKHWSDVDKKAMRDPGVIRRVKKGFEKTPFKFNLYFYQSTDPNYDKLMQQGVRDLNWIERNMGETAAQEIAKSTHPDTITVVMTNNLADDNQISIGSPWIVAHRIGHTLISGQERLGSSYQAEHVFNQFVKDASRAYGQNWPNPDTHYGYVITKENVDIYLKEFGNAIGTMRSAREGKIERGYEWIIETFTQYLITGKVTIRQPPADLGVGMDYPTDPKKVERLQRIWAAFPGKCERAFARLLKDARGKIWII